MSRVDWAQRLIAAEPDRVFRAFVEPDLLARWLPPEGATGRMDALEPVAGGALEMTLTFDKSSEPGKTTADTDVVKGTFVSLDPGREIVQQFEFVSDDPAFAGVMTMRWTFEARDDGTLTTVEASGVPRGIDAQVHERALASSLDNLAAMLQRH